MVKPQGTFVYIFILSVILVVSGCSSLKEAARGIAGISTKQLEELRNEAEVKEFDYDLSTSYERIKGILVKQGSYIYTDDKKKQLIAIYVSSDDTTPVGIFYSLAAPGRTKIEVASPSTYAKELIANRLFSKMEKTIKTQEEAMRSVEEGGSDERK